MVLQNRNSYNIYKELSGQTNQQEMDDYEGKVDFLSSKKLNEALKNCKSEQTLGARIHKC